MSDGQTIPGGLHGPSLTPSATPLAGPGLGSPDLRSWVMRKSPSIVPGNDQSVYLARRLRRPDRASMARDRRRTNRHYGSVGRASKVI